MSFDFVFPIYNDQELVMRLITDLRRFFPESKLIAVSDGLGGNLMFADFCRQHQVVFVQAQQRLKTTEFGGLWLERLLNSALAHSNAEFVIRTEGDTKFLRAFKSLPDSDVAGTLNERYGFKFPRGGCVFFKRQAIADILNSKYLQDPKYCNNPRFFYRRYSQFRYPHEKYDSTKIVLGDLILGDVINRLNLQISEWDEVNIQFRTIPEPGNFAAIHPLLN